MANGRGWVPGTAEMQVFQAKVSGNQKLGGVRKAQDSAIVANATNN
jgi:hypothetical protein